MREIGSEFWDVPIAESCNHMFPESTQWYLSGRSALQAIIKALGGCHTVAIPSWCCDSMVKPFVEAKMEVHFYPVYWNDGLIQEIRSECDVLFIMDYFGYTDYIPDLSGYNGVVIRDITHSIFSTHYNDADYYFGSLRKWCGVWTGGYAWTRNGDELQMQNTDDGGYAILREKAMELKNCYINGHVDIESNVADKRYLKVFEKAEDCLENIGIAPAKNRDIWLARRIDVDYIKSRRRANAEILMEVFSDWLIFTELKQSDCPMFVPVLIPDGRRNELMRKLIRSEIYCPIHWPVGIYHNLDKDTELLYKNELSLVCDQRYTEENMYWMVETIKRFWRGK